MIVRPLDLASEGGEPFLDGLNACFPGWGGPASFEWAFGRSTAGRTPDLMVAEADGTIVAGCGLLYRTVRSSSGDRRRIGILAGAWTLPDRRKNGAFTRLIGLGRSLAARRDAATVGAFVHIDNPSTRRLVGAGAGLVPSFYAGLADPARLGPAPWRETEIFGPDRRGTVFDYERDEFEHQFARRPRAVAALSGDGWRALVEQGDALLLVEAETREAFAAAVRAAGNRAAEAGRPLTCFTTDLERRDVLARLGFEISAGGFALMPPAEWNDWNLEGGDRI